MRRTFCPGKPRFISLPAPHPRDFQGRWESILLTEQMGVRVNPTVRVATGVAACLLAKKALTTRHQHSCREQHVHWGRGGASGCQGRPWPGSRSVLGWLSSLPRKGGPKKVLPEVKYIWPSVKRDPKHLLLLLSSGTKGTGHCVGGCQGYMPSQANKHAENSLRRADLACGGAHAAGPPRTGHRQGVRSAHQSKVLPSTWTLRWVCLPPLPVMPQHGSPACLTLCDCPPCPLFPPTPLLISRTLFPAGH